MDERDVSRVWDVPRARNWVRVNLKKSWVSGWDRGGFYYDGTDLEATRYKRWSELPPVSHQKPGQKDQILQDQFLQDSRQSFSPRKGVGKYGEREI